ncbi:hypothetical protein [Streptomyces sp. NPDC047985]|uniref:hypothetical protein n=1 Tax=Streptomyces sp. NPDC047985 TaxID=3155384 RepID=UPI0034259878
MPAVAKSKPAAPVVLDSGAPAYALVRVSDGGKGEDGEPVTAFSVVLQDGGEDRLLDARAAQRRGRLLRRLPTRRAARP